MNEFSQESARALWLAGVSFLVFVAVLYVAFELEEARSRKKLLRDHGLED